MNKNKYWEIDCIANSLLTKCVNDYASRIYEEIKEDVREDVILCSAINETGNMEDFSDGDVELAIGRAFCKRIGLEF